MPNQPAADIGDLAMLGGRRLLAFSDNRQDAAFFAPFFEGTSFRIALRAAIVRVLQRVTDDAPYTLSDLGEDVYKRSNLRRVARLFSTRKRAWSR